MGVRGLIRPIQHLVSVSGGKDSTATYLLAIESGRPFRAVFADTGNEHEATYEYVATLHENTGGPKVEWVRADFSDRINAKRQFIADDQRNGRNYGKPGAPSYGRRIRWTNAAKRRALALLRPTGNPYLDLCMWKGRFPSRRGQFCTSELKEIPITTQIVGPMLRAGPVLQWLGIRADESARRAKQPRYNRHESGSYVWRPIFGWTVDDVWKMHSRHGILPNPLYAQGMGRVGCMPCINCRKGELRAIADQFPDHIDRIREWEAIVATASKRGASTFFAAVTDPMDSQRDGYAGIDTIVEWSRTQRGGRQRDIFFQAQAGGGCTSDLGLCETNDSR